MVENKTNKMIKTIITYFVLIFMTAMCVFPFIVVTAASFSSEGQIMKYGYTVFPRGFTTQAYQAIFENVGELGYAYTNTIITTMIGATLSVLVMAMAAYPLARSNYKWKRFFNLYFYITMIFSGGAVAQYMTICQTLHLKNSYWVLILPSLVSAWNIFLLRTYFKQVPYSLIEAAQIDGASEMFIFFRIVIPLSRVGIATIFVMMLLAFWNSWYANMMYMSNNRYMMLQYYLVRILNNAEEMLKMENIMGSMGMEMVPSETMRMALCVVAAGPMVFVFMFFQKYFSKGLVMGSVKG